MLIMMSIINLRISLFNKQSKKSYFMGTVGVWKLGHCMDVIRGPGFREGQLLPLHYSPLTGALILFIF